MSSPATSAHSSSWGAHTNASEVAEAFASEIRGRNVIVTGPSPNSIGAETARVIALNGANLVVLAGRAETKLNATRDAILAESPTARIETLVLDLTSMESVRKAAKEVIGRGERIHVLINNAGIMAHPYKKTVDGFESQFAANHLGHFLFTGLLLNARFLVPFSHSHPVRIVNLTSLGHRFSGVRFDDPGFSDGKDYDEWKSYGQSKSANMLFAVGLSKKGREKGLVAYSVQPGAVGTNLADGLDMDVLMRAGLPTGPDGSFFSLLQTVGQGTATTIVAAFSPSILSTPGAYLDNCQVNFPSTDDPLFTGNPPDYKFQVKDGPSTPAHRSLDERNAEKLWKLSEEMVGEKIDF